MVRMITLDRRSIKDYVRFRLYEPTTRFIGVAKIRLKNFIIEGKRTNKNVSIIDAVLMSDNQISTSEKQFTPFFIYRKELREKFNFVFNRVLIQDALKTPSLISHCDIIFLKLSFRTPEAEVFRIMKWLNQVKGQAKLVYYDGDDDACVQWPDLLKQVDLYVKKHLFSDRDLYRQKFNGKSNLTDYVCQHADISLEDHTVLETQPIEPELIDKLYLSHNIGLDDNILALYKGNLSHQITKKENDIICRATVSQDHWTYHLRKDVAPKLEGLASQCKVLTPQQRVSQEEYYQELLNSKICVSPFGFGEICWRDFEAVLCQCLLIKPDMSHIETEPNIYVPYETYIPVKWDFSDLEEKCLYYLAHPHEREKIVWRAYQVLEEYYQDKKFLASFETMLQQIDLIC